jgi:DNA-directed RNA polymerase subunit delta
MATKPDKEKKSPGKTGSASAKTEAKKTSPKAKKPMDDDDDDEMDDADTTSVSKKPGKAIASSKAKKDDDDDDDGVEDGPDEWEKPEEEEEWDPDFEEFDVPKSKVKKADTGKKKAVEDDFTFEDDEFKDLLNDKDYDDDEEDDY